MAITRAGPPTTHDSRLWRVPLSAPPSAVWQKTFQGADDSTDIAHAGRVQFERTALTFRSDEPHVPEWIEYIDRWIAHANVVESGLEDGRRSETTRAQEQTDARRQRASEANEKFKNL